MAAICIVCQTNPVNPAIGPSYCSRLCWNLSLREDYKYLTLDAIKNIALDRHQQLAERTSADIIRKEDSTQDGR